MGMNPEKPTISECHVIKQITEFVAKVEKSAGDVGEQKNERHRLILSDRHDEERKAEDVDESRYADKQRIHYIGDKIDWYITEEYVDSQRTQKDNQIQAHKKGEDTDRFTEHIFGVGHGTRINSFGGIEFAVILEEIGRDKYRDDCLCHVHQEGVQVRNR